MAVLLGDSTSSKLLKIKAGMVSTAINEKMIDPITGKASDLFAWSDKPIQGHTKGLFAICSDLGDDVVAKRVAYEEFILNEYKTSLLIEGSILDLWFFSTGLGRCKMLKMLKTAFDITADRINNIDFDALNTAPPTFNSVSNEHSLFVDFVIRYLGGLTPRNDRTIEFNPLLAEEFSDFKIKNLHYKNLLIDISYNKNSDKMYELYINGKWILSLNKPIHFLLNFTDKGAKIRLLENTDVYLPKYSLRNSLNKKLKAINLNKVKYISKENMPSDLTFLLKSKEIKYKF